MIAAGEKGFVSQTKKYTIIQYLSTGKKFRMLMSGSIFGEWGVFFNFDVA